MMNQDLVRQFFMLYTDLPEEEAERWDFLCRNAIGALKARLKEGAEAPEHEERLCAAAALWAGGDYERLKDLAAARSEEIRVGDIALKNTMGSQSRESGDWQLYALAQIGDLLAEQDGILLAVGAPATEGEPVCDGSEGL